MPEALKKLPEERWLTPEFRRPAGGERPFSKRTNYWLSVAFYPALSAGSVAGFRRSVPRLTA
jgi:hypothetical protein